MSTTYIEQHKTLFTPSLNRDESVRSGTLPIGVIQGSGLNQSNITDAMMEEDVDYYMASEDEADVYLQLVEE
jgi:hypothetical protein